jgi:integrase
MMIAAGADVAAVAANLGHASPATTLNAYAHALPQAQRQASAVLGAAWCGMAKAIPEKTGG